MTIGVLSPLTLALPTAYGGAAFVATTLLASAASEAIVGTTRDTRPYASAPDRWSPSHAVRRTAGARLRITSWPVVSGTGWRAAAMIQTADDPGLRGSRVLLRGRGRVPEFAESLGAKLDLCGAPGPSAPDGFSMNTFLRGRHLLWQASAENATAAPQPDPLARLGVFLAKQRRGLLDLLKHHFPRREALLLSSVLLGERTQGLQDVKTPFTELGLGHLFAVSGLHVGLIAGILAVCLKPLGAGPKTRWYLMLLGLGAYVLLSGMAFSTIRATLLVLGAMSGVVLGLGLDSLRLLSLLFWASIIWCPDMIVDTGFRLSYLAAGGIVVGLRLITPHVATLCRPLKWVSLSLAVSLAAQWATMPEVTSSFGWLNLYAPVYNLAVVPVFGAGVTLAVGSMLLTPVPVLAQAVAALAWALLRLLELAATLGGRATMILGLTAWRPLELGLYLAATGLFAMGLQPEGRGRRGLLVCALCLGGWLVLAGPLVSSDGRMQAWQFDVGQGDCALLVFPDKSTVMIDTGDRWRNGGSPFDLGVASWLRRRGISRLDGLILTHHHADHDGALANVLSRLQVERLWHNGFTDDLGDLENRSRIPAVDEILHQDGDWRLRCLYVPQANSFRNNENNRSLVVVLEHAGRPAGLWMGDLEQEGEAELDLAGLQGPDILKAGHHGSRTSSSQGFLDAVRPGRVILSCGVDNRHGHPSHGVFRAAGDTLRILRTDLDGSIGMVWQANGRFLGLSRTRAD